MRVVKFYVYFHRFHPDTLSISGVLNSIDDCLPSKNDNKKCFSLCYYVRWTNIVYKKALRQIIACIKLVSVTREILVQG